MRFLVLLQDIILKALKKIISVTKKLASVKVRTARASLQFFS